LASRLSRQRLCLYARWQRRERQELVGDIYVIQTQTVSCTVRTKFADLIMEL